MNTWNIFEEIRNLDHNLVEFARLKLRHKWWKMHAGFKNKTRGKGHLMPEMGRHEYKLRHKLDILSKE